MTALRAVVARSERLRPRRRPPPPPTRPCVPAAAARIDLQPSTASVAGVAWSPQAILNGEAFEKILAGQLARIGSRGLNDQIPGRTYGSARRPTVRNFDSSTRQSPCGFVGYIFCLRRCRICPIIQPCNRKGCTRRQAEPGFTAAQAAQERKKMWQIEQYSTGK